MAIGILPRREAGCGKVDQLFETLNRSNGMSEYPASHGLGITDAVPTAPFTGISDQLPQTHEDSQSLHSNSINKKRRPSKTKTTVEVRRSASTPHMRNLAQGDTSAISPTADKRRNKLGYHRTSVACGHCRRRKIRCQLAPDDPHGRCSQCLRLKKECNFYPVDQQAPNERTQQNVSSKTEGGGSGSTASKPPSPHGTSSTISEQVEGFASYNPRTYSLPMDGDTGHGMVRMNGGPLPHQPYHYAQPTDSSAWASSGYTSSTPVSGELSGGASNYWSQTQPSTSPPYQDPSGEPGQVSGFSDYPYRQAPEHGYKPPLRSMSYPNIGEMIPQQYSSQPANPPHDYRRHSHQYPYPTLDTSNVSMGGPVAGPMSAPLGPSYGYQSSWSPYPIPSQRSDAANPTVYGATHYYGEQPTLGKVEEEPPFQYGVIPSYFSTPQASSGGQ